MTIALASGAAALSATASAGEVGKRPMTIAFLTLSKIGGDGGVLAGLGGAPDTCETGAQRTADRRVGNRQRSSYPDADSPQPRR